MAEWWNLDQVMIWAQTRNPDLVALAAGDAAGRKSRNLAFIDVMPTEDGEESEELQTGLSRADLIDMLDTGKLTARDAEDETASYPLDIPFSNYHCVIADDDGVADPHLALRSAAYPYRWRYILIAASDVRQRFPSKAPAEMQAELARMHATLKEQHSTAQNPAIERTTRPRRITRTERAKQAIALLYPEGLASADDKHGTQSAQIRQVIREVGKSGVNISEGLVRYAAGIK